MKTTYRAGKYLLIREVVSFAVGVGPNSKEEENYLYLTATQAKALMKDSLYNRLGFKSIELVEEIV